MSSKFPRDCWSRTFLNLHSIDYVMIILIVRGVMMMMMMMMMMMIMIMMMMKYLLNDRV